MFDINFIAKFFLRTEILMAAMSICAFCAGYLTCFIKLRVRIEEVTNEGKS